MSPLLICPLLITAVTLILMGCGGSGNRPISETDPLTPTFQDPGQSPQMPLYPNTPGQYGNQDSKTGAPLYEFEIHGSGYSTQNVAVETGSVLRMRFVPLGNDANPSGSNYNPQYSRLSVTLSVNGREVVLPLLGNELSGSQQRSGIIDFSLAPGSSKRRVTIEITRPNTDYWCFNARIYCPHTRVERGHPWHGLLLVETDETESLK